MNKIMEKQTIDSLTQAKATIIDLSIRYGPKAVVAMLIFVVGFVVARSVGNVTQKWLDKRELEPPVRLLLVRVLRTLVLALFVVMALQNLGVELLPLIAGLGVAGVGVGLAMQGVLSNVVAGLTIIFTKPFRVGEYIAIAGVDGQVETIDIFSTVLSHADKSRVVVPNRKIVGEILHNYGKIRQLSLSVGVAYGTDLNRALALVREICAQNPRVLKDPAPAVGVSTLADSSITLTVAPWVKVLDFGPAGGELNKAIVERFRENSIEIPFPQREVRLLSNSAA